MKTSADLTIIIASCFPMIYSLNTQGLENLYRSLDESPQSLFIKAVLKACILVKIKYLQKISNGEVVKNEVINIINYSDKTPDTEKEKIISQVNSILTKSVAILGGVTKFYGDEILEKYFANVSEEDILPKQGQQVSLVVGKFLNKNIDKPYLGPTGKIAELQSLLDGVLALSDIKADPIVDGVAAAKQKATVESARIVDLVKEFFDGSKTQGSQVDGKATAIATAIEAFTKMAEADLVQLETDLKGAGFSKAVQNDFKTIATVETKIKEDRTEKLDVTESKKVKEKAAAIAACQQAVKSTGTIENEITKLIASIQQELDKTVQLESRLLGEVEDDSKKEKFAVNKQKLFTLLQETTELAGKIKEQLEKTKQALQEVSITGITTEKAKEAQSKAETAQNQAMLLNATALKKAADALELAHEATTIIYTSTSPITFDYRSGTDATIALKSIKIAEKITQGKRPKPEYESDHEFTKGDYKAYCISQAKKFEKMAEIIAEVQQKDTDGTIREKLAAIDAKLLEIKGKTKNSEERQNAKIEAHTMIEELKDLLLHKNIIGLNDTLKVLDAVNIGVLDSGSQSYKRFHELRDQLNNLAMYKELKIATAKYNQTESKLEIKDKTGNVLIETSHSLDNKKLHVIAGDPNPEDVVLIQIARQAFEASSDKNKKFTITDCENNPTAAIKLYLLGRNLGLSPKFATNNDLTDQAVKEFISSKAADPQFKSLINIYTEVVSATSDIADAKLAQFVAEMKNPPKDDKRKPLFK